MLSNLFWILNYIRKNLLEAFELPELGISYWEFLCLLAIVGIVITVLVNSVQVSAGHSQRLENVKDKERARLSVRNSSSKSVLSPEREAALDAFDKFIENREY